MRKSLLGLALLAASAPGASIATLPESAAPASTNTSVARTARTVSGQPLRLPQGKAEMVATAVEILPNGKTTIHQHPWSRFVYVERGPLRVADLETGKTLEFQTGQVFAEVVAQWHQGSAPGPRGARLVVIDLVPPGVTNMTMR